MGDGGDRRAGACRVRRAVAALVALAALATAGEAEARRRLVREIGVDDAMLAAGARAVTRDAEGYVWIGAPGGLLRWDGHVLARWVPDEITGTVVRIAVDPRGGLLAAEWGGVLWRVDGRAAAALPGPDGTPVRDVEDVRFDGRGRLWLATATGLLRLDPDGRWHRPYAGRVDGANVRVLGPLRDGAIGGATASAVWALDDDAPRALVRLANVNGFAQSPAGTLWLVDRGATLYEVRLETAGARIEARGTLPASAWDLTLAGEVAYAATDRGLLRGVPGAVAEPLGVQEHVGAATRVFADHEGSVWQAGLHGLHQWVQPETAVITERDGLPMARYLTRREPHLWIQGWGGPRARVDDRDPLRRVEEVGPELAYERSCVDAAGGLWSGQGATLQRELGGEITRFDLAAPGRAPRFEGCAPLDDGRVVVAATDGAFVAAAAAPPWPLAIPDEVAAGGIHAVAGGRGDEVWLASHDQVCGGPLAAALRCTHVAGAHGIERLHVMPSGRLWIATGGRGIVALERGRVIDLEGNRALASRRAQVIVAARAPGTFWIGGEGFVLRVRERLDLADGWEVVERLGAAQGLPTIGAGDLVEDADGRVWIAQAGELTEVAPAARAVVPPGRLALARAEIDGVQVDGDGPWPVRGGDGHVELTFAATALRDPRALRFRFRVDGGRWTAPSGDPVLALVGLGPGHHRVEAAASVDGVHWVATAAPVRLVVPRPWWQRPWLWAVAALALTGGLLLAQRARYLVRLRLADQRMRIAMDLHDDVGSGLGSIGLMARVLEVAGEGGRTDVPRQIGETARSLSQALTDIVVALRAGSDRLDALAGYLVDRASALTGNGGPRLVTSIEGCDGVRVSFAVRRAVQGVVIEALHNASRHARASQVQLGFARQAAGWCVWVEDDGAGLDAAAGPRPGGGLGLEAMRRRAAGIRARLTIGPGAGGRGTRVELWFRPDARARRPR